MNQNVKDSIEKYAHQSHSGLLRFPELLGHLVNLGVQSYFADYRNQSTTYYSGNECLSIPLDLPSIQIQNIFNRDAVLSAIRGAQSDLIRYPEFLRLTMSAGCIGYIVWISGRHVSYFGRNGETHIEQFPQG